MLRRIAAVALFGVAACLSIGADAAEQPAVARAVIPGAGGAAINGTVFFLALESGSGAVAVGAAHSFDLDALRRAGALEFQLGRSQRPVAVSKRYLAPPGRSFNAPGATLGEDFVVFALIGKPTGVSILEPERTLAPRAGKRVRILGIPNDLPQDEDDIFGTVANASDSRIEVELDTPADLRGWGGAPVIDIGSGRVLGLLEAAWPSGTTFRVGVAPIAGVLEALEKPLEGGLGRAMSEYSPPRAEPSPSEAAEHPSGPAVARTTPRPGDGAGGVSRTPPTIAPPRPLEGRPKLQPLVIGEPIDPSAAGPEIQLEIEYPADGAVIGNVAGAFLAGRAIALFGELRSFDVVFVLDTSGSTAEPTGVDVNGNGIVGEAHLGVIGGIFGLGSTDPGDSVLAAEIEAALKLLRGLDRRNTRVALVTFAGEPSQDQGSVFVGRRRKPAITEEPLTKDYGLIEKALYRVGERGAQGMTHMAAGVDQATVELLGLRGSLSDADPQSEKFVLFFTDGTPTLPHEGYEAANVRAVLRAANRARRAHVRIHALAIGPDALAGPVATVEMASRTDGQFIPVRDPGALVNVIDDLNFVNIDEIRVRNLTLQSPAHLVESHADGSWNALVPLATGKNVLEVVARASDGSEAKEDLTVHYAPGSADPILPPDLIARRNRLLEQRLVEIRRGRIDAERTVAEETRRELALEIERERAAAAQRAQRQRKELDLEVEGDSPSPPGAGDAD